jgi:carbamoyl-phosphate synthase large subunit
MGNDMKIKLLISGLGGSLFPYLHEKLKDKFELYYVDADEQLAHLYKGFNFTPSPLVSDPRYWELVKHIIKSEGINYYIPLIDEEIVIAKKEVDGFSGVQVMAPTADFSALCLNKYLLMGSLKTENISDVLSFTADDFNGEIEMPLFIKPISGRGSRGIKKIYNHDELEAYYSLEGYKKSDILIQPLLDGVEYTVGVLADKANNFLSISCKRIIKKKGITQIAVTEDNPVIEAVALKIIEKYKPCGPFNIQLILTPKEEVKIFEINPRFSTTTILEIEAGINPIEYFINSAGKKQDTNVVRPKAGIVLHRRWESLFYEV